MRTYLVRWNENAKSTANIATNGIDTGIDRSLVLAPASTVSGSENKYGQNLFAFFVQSLGNSKTKSLKDHTQEVLGPQTRPKTASIVRMRLN